VLRQCGERIGDIAQQAGGSGVVRAVDLFEIRRLHQQQSRGALHTIAFAFDDAEQPGGIGVDLAKRSEFPWYQQQAFLHRILDIVHGAVILGIAPQILTRACQHLCQRLAVAPAGLVERLVEDRILHETPRLSGNVRMIAHTGVCKELRRGRNGAQMRHDGRKIQGSFIKRTALGASSKTL
jgi:hypothetical protein